MGSVACEWLAGRALRSVDRVEEGMRKSGTSCRYRPLDPE